ncbi:hypothetical protein BH11PLA1_BH11PLA1_20980 [soil metagenome]
MKKAGGTTPSCATGFGVLDDSCVFGASRRWHGEQSGDMRFCWPHEVVPTARKRWHGKGGDVCWGCATRRCGMHTRLYTPPMVVTMSIWRVLVQHRLKLMALVISCVLVIAIPTLSGGFPRSDRVRMTSALGWTAISDSLARALELYYSENGIYPLYLSSLVPRYLDKISPANSNIEWYYSSWRDGYKLGISEYAPNPDWDPLFNREFVYVREGGRPQAKKSSDSTR